MALSTTPGHVRQARGDGQRISLHRDEFINVQTLYLDRKFKQCMAVCENSQRAQIHPLHQAFLWYYHAACNECMGLAAHNLSGKKVCFLESAKDSLKMALSTLPLPYVTTTSGGYAQEEHSPLNFNFPASEAIIDPQNPCDRVPGISASDSINSIYSSESYDSETYTALEDENELTPSTRDSYIQVLPATGASPTRETHLSTATTVPSTHKDRLSQSLSITHTLADDLVPSPLFSRSKKYASVTPLEDTGIIPVNNFATPRPLPPLPFNHKANFQIQGTRIVQLHSSTPMRKTAVQTLIARFESCLPLPPSPSHSLSTISESPVTPRFKIIKDAFSPHPVNHHLDAYLSSVNLSRYNTSLADFRAQVRRSIVYLDEQILQVQNTQAHHATSKSLSKNRLASFWSLEHAALAASCSKSSGYTQEMDDAKVTAKARIEKLRKEGWQVRKDRYGFKGEQYYENFRRTVERELDAYTKRDIRLRS